MAYDDSAYRRPDVESTDPVGFSARDDSPRAGLQAGDHRESPTTTRRVPPARLHDVFDDPGHGEPGRDRLAVHWLWEFMLLAATAAVALLFYRASPESFRGDGLDVLLVAAAVLGLLALGAGLTLRAGVPNLALGPVAVAAALHFAENGDRGTLPAVLPAAAVAAGLGLVLALIVVGFHVPAWAASLAGALAVVVYIQQRSAPVTVQGGYDPSRHALYLFGGFAALALLGGLFGAIRPVRRSVGRFRPVTDPADRRGGFAAALAGVAIVASTVFAMLAGVLLAAGSADPVSPTTGFEWTGLALGAALLGGTSAFGRRGGIFGSLFTVVLITLFVAYSDERGWNVSLFSVAAVAMRVGVIATRLVESYGRPRSTGEADAPTDADTPGTFGWTTDRPESWSSTLPVQPTESRSEPWGADRWGTSDR
ncbi:MAG TPA: ABC transporter permease [Micromonosporaceae bacterium]|nr:ABC transporter permease [Micromonosporaceae bacterium]